MPGLTDRQAVVYVNVHSLSPGPLPPDVPRSASFPPKAQAIHGEFAATRPGSPALPVVTPSGGRRASRQARSAAARTGTGRAAPDG